MMMDIVLFSILIVFTKAIYITLGVKLVAAKVSGIVVGISNFEAIDVFCEEAGSVDRFGTLHGIAIISILW